MDIKPLGSMPSRRTPADYFTGTVWQEPIIEETHEMQRVGAIAQSWNQEITWY